MPRATRPSPMKIDSQADDESGPGERPRSRADRRTRAGTRPSRRTDEQRPAQARPLPGRNATLDPEEEQEVGRQHDEPHGLTVASSRRRTRRRTASSATIDSEVVGDRARIWSAISAPWSVRRCAAAWTNSVVGKIPRSGATESALRRGHLVADAGSRAKRSARSAPSWTLSPTKRTCHRVAVGGDEIRELLLAGHAGGVPEVDDQRLPGEHAEDHVGAVQGSHRDIRQAEALDVRRGHDRRPVRRTCPACPAARRRLRCRRLDRPGSPRSQPAAGSRSA